MNLLVIIELVALKSALSVRKKSRDVSAIAPITPARPDGWSG